LQTLKAEEDVNVPLASSLSATLNFCIVNDILAF